MFTAEVKNMYKMMGCKNHAHTIMRYEIYSGEEQNVFMPDVLTKSKGYW